MVHRGSSPDAKIALFRSLFRGREDVFARRFESRTTGRSGYRRYADDPQVKFKESIKKIVGIPVATVAGTDE